MRRATLAALILACVAGLGLISSTGIIPKALNIVDLTGSTDVNPAGLKLAVQSGTGANETSVATSIAAPAAGLGTTDARLVYHASMEADAQDVAGAIYVGYFADTFSNAGGASDAAGLYVALGYSAALFAASGDLEFEDYSPNIGTVNSEQVNQNGYNLRLSAEDGYDSGVVARNGGSISLTPGANVNSGTDGQVRIHAASATQNDNVLFIGNGAGALVSGATKDAHLFSGYYSGATWAGSGVPLSLDGAFAFFHDTDTGFDYMIARLNGSTVAILLNTAVP